MIRTPAQAYDGPLRAGDNTMSETRKTDPAIRAIGCDTVELVRLFVKGRYVDAATRAGVVEAESRQQGFDDIADLAAGVRSALAMCKAENPAPAVERIAGLLDAVERVSARLDALPRGFLALARAYKASDGKPH
jgi:hypothetical protein